MWERGEEDSSNIDADGAKPEERKEQVNLDHHVLHGGHDEGEDEGHGTANDQHPRADVHIASIMHRAVVLVVKSTSDRVANGEKEQTELDLY